MKEDTYENVLEWKLLDDEIHTTDSYEMFKMLPYNRRIDHEKGIMSSIRKIGYVPSIIIVNENMEIIDGQHRFTVCKTLGLPIYYAVVPGLGIKQCSELNSVSKNWSTKNHVFAYTSPEFEDNESYIYYMLLSEEHPKMTPTQLSCMLAPLYKTSGRGVRALIRNGDIKISESDYNHVTKKIAWAEELLPIRIEGNKEYFWEAISYLYEIDAVDNKKLKSRIMKYLDEISPVGKIDTFLYRIEAIYNKGSKKNKVYMRQEYEKYKEGVYNVQETD